MAKSKALIAAEAKIAALEAHNAEAEQHITELMVRIAELEAALNTRGVNPAVSHYTDRAGRVWEKTRVGQPRNVAPR